MMNGYLYLGLGSHVWFIRVLTSKIIHKLGNGLTIRLTQLGLFTNDTMVQLYIVITNIEYTGRYI